MKYEITVFQGDQSFRVLIHTPPKLADAKSDNKESFWYLLDPEYIGCSNGDLVVVKSASGSYTCALFFKATNALQFEEMFDFHGTANPSGDGMLYNFDTKKITKGKIRWKVTG